MLFLCAAAAAAAAAAVLLLLMLLLLLFFLHRFLRRRRCSRPPPPSRVVVGVASHCERTYFSLEAIRLYLFNGNRETMGCEIAGKPSRARKRTWRNWIQSCCHDLDTCDLFHVYVNEYCSDGDRTSDTHVCVLFYEARANVRVTFFSSSCVKKCK